MDQQQPEMTTRDYSGQLPVVRQKVTASSASAPSSESLPRGQWEEGMGSGRLGGTIAVGMMKVRR